MNFYKTFKEKQLKIRNIICIFKPVEGNKRIREYLLIEICLTVGKSRKLTKKITKEIIIDEREDHVECNF